jgi:hypothetical protein
MEARSDKSTYYCKHCDWSGNVEFYNDGNFYSVGRESGKFYVTNGCILTLAWDSWPAEQVYLKNSKWIGSRMVLTKFDGQTDVVNLNQNTQVSSIKVVVSDCNQYKEGYFNAGLPNFDCRDRLPFADNSLSELVMEEGIFKILTPSQMYLFCEDALRMLQQDGKLELQFSSIEELTAKKSNQDAVKALKDYMLAGNHKNFPSKTGYVQMLSILGFTVKESVGKITAVKQ